MLVSSEAEIVLKAVNYFEDGMTPFDAFHAATAETRGLPSDETYDEASPTCILLGPDE